MNKILETRLKLRSELEAPPVLRKFGSGWISGVIGFVFGVAALLLMIAIRAPGILSVPPLQALHDNPWFRLALFLILLGSFLASLLSLILRPKKILGLTGLTITLLATIIGGTIPASAVRDSTPVYFGLDFFVLNVLFTGFLFVPLERLFPRNDQPLFRAEYREDLFYYLVSSMLVQILTFLTFLPANTLKATLPLAEIRAWVGALPFIVQFFSIMFLTDLVQYWVHRCFHRIPSLWRFHAVHHSAQTMDWIAGARMHFVEILVLRSTTVIPMFVLGFHESAINAYVFTVYLYSTFIHSNVNWRFPFTERILVTPRFHHWHHGIEPEAIDVNFAIHFPIFDRLFGTHFLPENRWPSGYGVEGHPVPKGYWKQLRYPFRRPAAAVIAASE
ncbi:MAG TPA: sterol desaturase family protein [Bryobacteraceae bacterium]|jgi:sterol desaturase/sphingolipid hydroxylase (fatty acid hydroxylase superfamily)